MFNKGDFKKAEKFFKRSSKADKTNPKVWNYLGLTYLKLDKTKNSRKSFEKAIKIAPMKSEYYSNLAYVYLTDQKTNKTQDLCHKAIELDAKNKSAFYFRGISFLWEGQYEKAIADAESVISLDSDFINGYILKSDALLYSFRSGMDKGIQEIKPRKVR